VGEFTILLGAFGAGLEGGAYASMGGVWWAGISAAGVIMAAIYILYMFQKMFLGPEGSIVEEVKHHGHALRDLNWREIITVTPLLIFIFWIGLYPAPFFQLIGPSVEKLVAALQTAAMAMP
jgi:NADH-quinone oxidoreductase subunit M